MTTSHRDLAQPDPWTRSLERSLHRRAITPQIRRTLARRRRASVALSTLMVAGPTASLLGAAGFGLGGRGIDVAQASPANRAIEDDAPPAAMAFELGSRGDAVAEIQRQLGVPVDAIFGPVTHAAVLDFQARNGLDVDGIVGPVTWTALFGLGQAAAAAGAGDGGVAVILREREPTGDTADGAPRPAIGGGDAPDGHDDAPTGGDGPVVDGGAPDAGTAPRTVPVSVPAPDDGACGTLRLGSPVDGTVTSGYGPRWGRNHDGIDIAAPTGTPIRAAECGVVSFAGVQGGYGNMVCVKHSSRFETCYAHMSRYAVAQGQRVDRGQVIGYVGCTGSCTGPHLHFETRVDGAARDPRPYLGGAGVPGEPTVKAATRAQLTASIRKDVARARVTAKATLAAQPQATTALAPTAIAQPGGAVAPTGQAPTAATPPVAAPAQPGDPAPPESVPTAPSEPGYATPPVTPQPVAAPEPTYQAPPPVSAPAPEPSPYAPAPAAGQAPAPPATPVGPPPSQTGEPAPVAAAPTEPPAATAQPVPEPTAVAPPVEAPPVEDPPVETPPVEPEPAPPATP